MKIPFFRWCADKVKRPLQASEEMLYYDLERSRATLTSDNRILSLEFFLPNHKRYLYSMLPFLHVF